jgi:hypothetical protein
LKPLPEPGGANTMMLFVTLRLVTVEGPVRFQVVPFVRLTLEVAPEPVWIVPVNIEALALNVAIVPAPVA